MIEVNRYRQMARTFAFICYVVAVAVFGGGILLSLVALAQRLDHIQVEGLTNARLAIMSGYTFAVCTLVLVLLGWRIQRVFGQHRRTEKPVARATVGCLRLSSLGCMLWSLYGLFGLIFTGQILTLGKPLTIGEWFVAISGSVILSTLMISVAQFISRTFVRLNDHERKGAYELYLNDVQVALPSIAYPEMRAFLQQQTSYVLPKLDQTLKGTLLKDLSSLKLLTGSTRIMLRNADFRGADLCSSDLPEADLREINLEGARLEGALLFKVNLHKARLKECNLSRARLQEANLQQANLTKAALVGARLRAANLHGAILEKANFSHANLQGANLQEANLRHVNFEEAVLKETDLRGADLTGTTLTTEQLQQAIT